MTDRATPAVPYVRPDVAAFLRHRNASAGPQVHERDARSARTLYRTEKDLAELPVGDLATIRDLEIPGPAGPLAARLFDAAESRAPCPAIVFFHGGGFVLGDLDTHASFCSEAARQLDLPVIAVDYRLAPESPWPAAPDDCEAAARWVADAPSELGRAVTSLILLGDSAGGSLAITTAMTLRDAPAAVPVIVQAPIYPVTDLNTRYPSIDAFAEGHLLTRDALAWFGEAYAADRSDARGSPMVDDLAGMPPAVVLTASLDPLRDQGRAYAGALIGKGIATVYREALGNIHGFVTLRRAIPSGQGDITGYFNALRQMIVEAEATRVMAQAAG